MELRLFHPKERGLGFFPSRLHSKCKTSLKTKKIRTCGASRERYGFYRSPLHYFLSCHWKTLWNPCCMYHCSHPGRTGVGGVTPNIVSSPAVPIFSRHILSHRDISLTAHPSTSAVSQNPVVRVQGRQRMGSRGTRRQEWPELIRGLDACINSY